MNKPAISVCLDDLKLEVKAAMDRARALGFRAIDVSAVTGPVSCAELSTTGRRHLRKHLDDLGLRLGSLRGPVGGPSYADPAGGESRLEKTLKIIDLASGLRVPVVSTTLGLLHGPVDLTQSERLGEALSILADRADRAGVIVAIETADIPAVELNRLLAHINCPMLAASCDSGAMIMRGEDPHRIADWLAGCVRLARARDALGGSAERTGYEVPIGQGALDPPRFLAALEQAGFGGDIVLTRTSGTNPSDDLQRAREVFERMLE